jgi:hypothetical protein
MMRPHLLLVLAAATLIACEEATPPPAAPAVGAAPEPSAAPAVTAAPEVTATAAAAPPAPPPIAQLVAKATPLTPGDGPAAFDYIVADRAAGRIWVPNARLKSGGVDVFDIAKGSFSRVDKLKTKEAEREGKKRVMGPSSAAIGDGFAYVGNRGTSEVCAVDAKTLKVGACLKLPSPPDGVAYVASAKEVWVTTPHDSSLTVLDASKPAKLTKKAVIKVEGEPEGYAVDDVHGLFFTNLEDKNKTLVIDVKAHAVKATWSPGCGDDGPRGLAVDGSRMFLMVACTDHVTVLDAARDGASLGRVDTGAGVDNIDYLGGAGLLYVAAGKAGKLTIAHVDDKGVPTIVAIAATADRARNAVVDAGGNAYLVDPAGPSLLAVPKP